MSTTRSASIRKRLLHCAIAITLLVAFALIIAPVAYASDSSSDEQVTPSASKTLSDNGDGTYTLELAIAGAASNSEHSSGANVMFVIDTSGSMAYSTTGQTSHVSERNSRMYATKQAVNSFASDLMALNTESHPDLVKVSMISFSSTVNSTLNWTSDQTRFTSAVNGLNATGGTNWKHALEAVNNMPAPDNDNPTYVIFITDGEPTFILGTERTNNKDTQACYNAALPAADVLAASGYTFYGLFAYGDDGTNWLDEMVSYVSERSVSDKSSLYIDAASTEDLQRGLDSILEGIIDDIVIIEDVDVVYTDKITSLTSTWLSGDVEADREHLRFYKTDRSGNKVVWEDADEHCSARFEQDRVVWEFNEDFALEDNVRYSLEFDVWPSQHAYDILAQLDNGFITLNDLTADERSQIVFDGEHYDVVTNPVNGAYITYRQHKITSDINGVETVEQMTGADADAPMVIPNPGNGMVLQDASMLVEKRWEQSLQERDLPDLVVMGAFEDGQLYEVFMLGTDNNWQAEMNISPGVFDQNGTVLDPGHTYSLEENFFIPEDKLPDGWSIDSQGHAVHNGHSYTGASFNAVEGGWEVINDYHYDLDASPVHPMLDGFTTDDEFDYVDLGSNTGATVNAQDLGEPLPTDARGRIVFSASNVLRSGLNLYTVLETDGTHSPDSNTFGYAVRIDYPENAFSDTDGSTDVWYTVYDMAGDSPSRELDQATYYSHPSGEEFDLTLTDKQWVSFINLPVGATYSIIQESAPTGCALADVSIAITTGGGDTLDAAGNTVSTETRTSSGTVSFGNASYETTFTDAFTYTVQPATATIPMRKIIMTHDGLEFPSIENGYSFVLEPIDNAPMPVVDGHAEESESYINDAADGGENSFGTITFHEAGTYHYTITENSTRDIAGVSGDPTPVKYVTITVEDDDNGHLVATVIGADTADAAFNEALRDSSDENGSFAPQSQAKLLAAPATATRSVITPMTTFITTYQASGAAAITATTSLDGRELGDGQFTFQLIDGNGTVIQTATNGADGSIVFEPIEYDVDDIGVNTYTIHEIGSGADESKTGGYTYSPDKQVTVTVTDAGNGTLETAPTSAHLPNAYRAHGETALSVSKILEGTQLPNGMFSFELYESGALVAAASNDADGEVVFDALSYTQADIGTHYYTITEKNTGLAGYTYDTHTCSATVTVSDNGDGTLTCAAAYDAPIFTNSYSAQGSVSISAQKALSGTALEAGQFSFTLYAEGGTSIETVTNDAGGAINFAPLSYDQNTEWDTVTPYTVPNNQPETAQPPATENPANNGDNGQAAENTEPTTPENNGTDEGQANNAPSAPEPAPATVEKYRREKTFHYTIAENNDGAPGYNYDSRTYAVDVTVVDDGDGHITATASYPVPAVFENSYTTQHINGQAITTGVTLTGRDLEERQFSVDLIDESGTVIQTLGNAADGSITFDSIEYGLEDAGEHEYFLVEHNDGKAGYTYDGKLMSVKVTVSDNGDGTLSTNTQYEEHSVFDNYYAATPAYATIRAEKKLVGKTLEDGEFTFSLEGSDGTSATTSNLADGSIVFPSMEYSEKGTWTYTVCEKTGDDPNITYDDSIYTFTVSVSFDEDTASYQATVECASTPVFANAYNKRAPLSLLATMNAETPDAADKQDAAIEKTAADGNSKNINNIDSANDVGNVPEAATETSASDDVLTTQTASIRTQAAGGSAPKTGDTLLFAAVGLGILIVAAGAALIIARRKLA